MTPPFARVSLASHVDEPCYAFAVSSSIVLVVVLHIAAGEVVDASATTTAGESFLAAAPGQPSQIVTVSARPQLRAAVASEGNALDVSYAPQLTGVVPSQQLVVVMHNASVAAELAPSHVVTLRLRANGSVGDLDPGSAQTQGVLFNSLGVVDATKALSFASGNVEAALGWKLSRVVTLDFHADEAATGIAPVENTAFTPKRDVFGAVSALEPVHRESAGLRTSLVLTRVDTTFVDADVIANTHVGAGPAAFTDTTATGVLGALGYARRFAPGISVETRAGALGSIADAGDHEGRQYVLLPLADLRLDASTPIAGGGAIDGKLTAGLTPTTDPLGALLEDRFGAQLEGAVRFTSSTSLSGAVFVAAPLFAFGGTSPAQAGAGTSATFLWAFSDAVALQANVVAQSRLLDQSAPGLPRSALEVDVTAQLGLTSTFTLFHSGGRPRGTDPRPGRAIGQTAIGAPPPPQESIPVEAPSEPPPDDDADAAKNAPIAASKSIAAPPIGKPVVLPDTPTPHQKDAKGKKKKSKKDADAPDKAAPDASAPTSPPAAAKKKESP